MENSTCKNYLQVQQEGNRQVQREIKVYNLQIILAIGYRVRNNIGIHFRNWASSILTKYMPKGFAKNYLNKEQIAGVEPVSPAWEANVLPMNHICIVYFTIIQIL